MQLSTVIILLMVLSISSTQNTIQPLNLLLSANEEGVFQCYFNGSNANFKVVVVWFLNGSSVNVFPIETHEYLQVTISEPDLVTVVSTLILLIDSTWASVFNNTLVQCQGILINEKYLSLLEILSANLFVQGTLGSPSKVRVHFNQKKMYTQWSHPHKQHKIATLAYHLNLTYLSSYSAESTIHIPDNNLCILYQLCIMEETIAGIGDSACINTSSSISVQGLLDMDLRSVNLFNHTKGYSIFTEGMFGCDDKQAEIYLSGDYLVADVLVTLSTNSLELKLTPPDSFIESDEITLELNLFQPNILHLQDILIQGTESDAEVYISCVYAQNNSVQGCLITIECDDYPDKKCSILLIGKTNSNIFQICNLQCSTGKIYAYAYSYGIVAEMPSVVKNNITFQQHLIPILTSTNSSILTDPIFVLLVTINLINVVIIVILMLICTCIVTILMSRMISRKYYHGKNGVTVTRASTKKYPLETTSPLEMERSLCFSTYPAGTEMYDLSMFKSKHLDTVIM